ncbi:aminotransferase class IV [Microvirga massiliensis]|uniref:aminotransferase class IV n=1 Tax=Microvirga massiliensis TaxID=1033741 RepID=UPI00062B3654|nr:aminotransferase class IV [Microvirga massiliensis]
MADAPFLSWPEPSRGKRREPVAARFAAGTAWTDGKIVPVAEATLPLLDWGFLRSDACQETISAWDGILFRLDDHLDRFWRSLDRLRMTSPLSREEIRRIIHVLIATAGYDNAYVQIIMTRGRPPIGSRDIRLCSNRFQAFCIPYVWIATPEVQERGLHLHVSRRHRVPAASVDPMVKHYHWLDFEMGLLEAYDAGAETVVLSDANGNILEGPGFNIFIRKGDKLLTPSSGMLDGMTRRTVMEICRDLGIPVEETDVPIETLLNADEIFLTTTAGGVLPVTSVDAKAIRNGPGPFTARIHSAYWQRRADGWLGDPIDYTIPTTLVAELGCA